MSPIGRRVALSAGVVGATLATIGLVGLTTAPVRATNNELVALAVADAEPQLNATQSVEDAQAPLAGPAQPPALLAPPTQVPVPSEIEPQPSTADPIPVVAPITGAKATVLFGKKGPMWLVAHSGIDFPTPIGTSVNAVVSGKIRAIFLHPAFGKVVELRRVDGLSIWYCHLRQPLVFAGQHVTQGQPVALSGASGHVSGPHLHFEVRVAGVPTDPLVFLVGTPGVPAAPVRWAMRYVESIPAGISNIEELREKATLKERGASPRR